MGAPVMPSTTTPRMDALPWRRAGVSRTCAASAPAAARRRGSPVPAEASSAGTSSRDSGRRRRMAAVAGECNAPAIPLDTTPAPAGPAVGRTPGRPPTSELGWRRR
jgi:hypothetical protein